MAEMTSDFEIRKKGLSVYITKDGQNINIENL
jgi:hypothetical protein